MTVRQKPVEEQVVVITGASSGIGLATAHLFASRGAKGLVLVARNEEALRKIADELSQGGTRAVAVPADVSKREDLERVARTAIETFGRFDTWVNDAAVALYGTLDEIPIEDQRQLFDVNYWGVVNGSMIAADHMRRRGGTIINVGSVLSERTMILQTQYSASKHAVKAFTDGLRMELENQGAPIAVTLIKPSSIDTPYIEHARNYLDRNNAVPPPAYDPHLVGKAIMFAAGIAALFIPSLSGGQRRRQAKRPTPRHQPTMRRTGNGHDKRTLGPGHVSQRGPYEGRPQPRH